MNILQAATQVVAVVVYRLQSMTVTVMLHVTWNHKSGVPEQNGQSARIEVNTDSTTGEGTMSFEVSSAAVTSGTAVNLPVGMTLAHDYVECLIEFVMQVTLTLTWNFMVVTVGVS